MITQEEFDRRSAEVRATAEYQEEMERLQLAHAVGQQVKAAREALKWSQSELARRAGMKPHAVSRLESGTVLPSLATLNRVANAMNQHLTIGFAA
jgi:HTH-type transcriptional regulator / antitoxin HipB